MNEHDHVVFGSLLHDIGKFFERAETLGEHCQSEDKRQQYCKANKNGQLGFFHVLRTLSFCEILFRQIPILKPSAQQNPEEHWAELASCHHNPTPGNEAYLEKLVQAADLFASAEREQGNFYEQGIHKKTRLESLLSRINLHNHVKEASHFLPLSALALESEAIYPKTAQAWGMTQINKDNNKVWLAEQALSSDYKNLAEAFLNDLKQFPNYAEQRPATLRAIVRTLLSLMEKYLSQVPAATNVLRPDISLFDHLRITSAIAEGLYDYHAANHNLATTNFKDQQTAKWLLICGDFSGIQNFIYKITSKGAAKGLRGRSFFIQLLCDAASEQLLRQLGLYPTARIYSSGGKFYLLISQSKLDALKQEVENINQALLPQFRGEVSLSIGVAEIKAEDFKEGNMGKRWQEANEDLMKNRQQIFAAQIAKETSYFAPEALHSQGACQVCDRDDYDAEIQIEKDKDNGEEIRICQQCKELREIGKRLAHTRYLFWVWGQDRQKVNNSRLQKLPHIQLCGTDCTLYFLKGKPKFSNTIRLYDSHLESLNDFESLNNNQHGYSTGFRFVGKWQLEKISGKFDFEDFAEQATGIHRIGVLRVDVDNLGEIFIRGLNFKQTHTGIESMGSLSRVATLSRQLHLFFAGYLSTLTSKFQHSQIIYAGGDDVFIIGSWDELPDVAKKIRDEFKRYCADNDVFTLSGGIVLAAGKYPISKMAEMAGKAEGQAKHLIRGTKKKDALSFLDTVIGWESFDAAVDLKKKICDLTDKTKSHALINRLRQVVIATNELKKQQPTPTLDILYYYQWRWRLIYNLKRMTQRNSDIENDLKELQKQLLQFSEKDDRQVVLDWLQMPVRWAEFLMREER